jgi:hypothetical protein
VPALSSSVTFVAIALLVGLVALQWAGVQVSSRFQQAATAVKFFAFLALVVAAFAIAGAPKAAAATAATASIAGVCSRCRPS